jgi:hypothetical protein
MLLMWETSVNDGERYGDDGTGELVLEQHDESEKET